MSGVIPVKIVTAGAATHVQLLGVGCGGSLDNCTLRIIDTDAKAAQVAGGLVPMTQVTYDALIASGARAG
jgi:hypothetical protein